MANPSPQVVATEPDFAVQVGPKPGSIAGLLDLLVARALAEMAAEAAAKGGQAR